MLSTDRLILRHWQHGDLDHLHRLCSNIEVMRYFPNIQDRSASRQMLHRLQNAFLWHPDYGVWALELKQTGEFVGMLGLQNCNLPFDFMPKIEILWRLLPQFWSQGLALEAALCVQDYALNHLRLPALTAYTSYPNLPSQRLMARLGMQPSLSFAHPMLPAHHRLSRHIAYFTKPHTSGL